MGRGPKKHLKRLNAPSHWMLDKMGGIFAPKPTPGPHGLRFCIPLTIIIKNRLKYAMNADEVKKLLKDKQGLIKVDNKVRKDPKFPCGIMDVITIEKTGEFFRILLDVKGRFQPHKIGSEEAKFKLCKVVKKAMGKNKIPYIVTNDGRTIRFPHPEIQIGDTIKLSLETGEVIKSYKVKKGNLAVFTAGSNKGRIGVITGIERHDAQFNIIRLTDTNGHKFASRDVNVMVLGEGKEPAITLYKDLGLKRTIIEEKKDRGKWADNLAPH